MSYKGYIYVVDCKNCCILVINCLGELIWELIDFGNIGLVVIVLNKRGNLIVIDVMIIRVYSLDGILLYNFFLVYSKRDLWLEFLVLIVDCDGVILVVDLLNYRI